MARIDGRQYDQLREIRMDTDFVRFPEGSVLITCGNTKVLCCASVEAVDMAALGERTITIDCDVLQGDGGTRTASVTGGFVALALACRKLMADGVLEKDPIRHYVAAVSAGIVGDQPMLDLCYEEDSSAMVDLNCVMNDKGELIEIQGTGEGRSFTLAEQQELVRLCSKGIQELMAKQRELLEGNRK